jgi:hypothetical protein
MFSLSSLLKSYFKESGLESGLLINKLRKEWPELVGEAIASHTSPESIKDKELTISVDTPQWMHHLGFFKEEITDKLKQHKLSEVRFRLGKPIKTGAGKVSVKAADLSGEDITYIEETLKDISDPALKEKFRELLRHGLTKGKSETK